MKKNLPLALLGAGALLALAANADVVFQQLRVTEPQPVRLPVMGNDSVDNRGSKFAASKLLKAKNSPDLSAFKSSVFTGDSLGKVELPSPSDQAYVSFVESAIRASRFAKGNLKIDCNVPFTVYVNGQEKGESETSIPMSLAPETQYEIRLKTITLPTDTAHVAISFVPEKDFEDVEIFNGPELHRRFELSDTQMGWRARSVRLSPDGKYLLTVYRNSFTHDKMRDWAELSETATGKMLNANMPSNLRWMPGENALYYFEKADGGHDLYKITVPDMRHVKVAEKIPDTQIEISPKGDYFIYYDLDEGKTPGAPLRRYNDPDDRQPGHRNHFTMVKYDMKTGLSQPLVYQKNNASLLDISNDGKKLLIQSFSNKFDEFPFYFSDVYTLDINTFATDTLIRHDGFFQGGLFSPDGKQLFVYGGPDFGGGVGLQIPEGMMANNYDVQGFLVDIASKKVTPVTKDFDPSLQTRNVVWNAADGKIYFQGEKGFDNYLYSFDPKTLKIQQIPTEIVSLSNFSIGQFDSQWVAYTGGGDTSSGEAYLYNLKTKKTRTIAQPFQERLDKIDMASSEPWWFTASDGTQIEGRCVLPADFDPDKKYPLIVYYYGGTSPSTSGINSPYSPQMFAARDYVVYVINPSGTTGYGQEFSARHVNAWGKRTSDDIIEGTKEFCRQHPFVDKDKIGCVGASYGGFMTQYLLTKTDIFAAAVSHAGISNVTSYWGEGYWGYSYNTVAAAKSYPWNNPKLFTEQGSLFNADKIHTPLLLLHGTADTNVPIGESIQLFNALKILGREVEFISVDGENHYISDYPKRELWHATMMAWFAKWLQDDPRWWDSMYKD